MSAPVSLPNNFEEALKELEVIVQNFENNVWTLEQAVEAYRRGVELKNFCTHKLESARLVMETVTKTSEGGAVPEELGQEGCMPITASQRDGSFS